MKNIRKARAEDAARLAEIEVFNYRLNFYPMFRNDHYYFEELQVSSETEKYRNEEALTDRTYVYDDGVVKGFIRIDGEEVEKLFVEPALQGHSIGAALLAYAIEMHAVRFLWALENNTRAIAFYERHGFRRTEDKMLEDGTTAYLIRLER